MLLAVCVEATVVESTIVGRTNEAYDWYTRLLAKRGFPAIKV